MINKITFIYIIQKKFIQQKKQIQTNEPAFFIAKIVPKIINLYNLKL
jgi:hypothetical protein